MCMKDLCSISQIQVTAMAVASGPPGPVLAGQVFTVVFENVHVQSATDGSKSCTHTYVNN